MKLLLDTVRNKNNSQIPIWLMRQAGRYLPEYREVRKAAGSFLDLCYNPELASKVTIQPIERFDFDAAIIFSDILVVPHILGLNVEFLEGEGPKVENILEENDLKKLSVKEKSDKIERVADAIRLTKEKLDKSKTMIGFAGSPWTVATYIISDKKHDFEFCRKFAYSKRDVLKSLINIITKQTIIYLKAQIDAGAELIQLFDSWSGVLCEEEFEEFVIKPTKEIIGEIRKYNSDIVITGFPKGAGFLYKNYAQKVGADCISLDQFVSTEQAKEIAKISAIQGNLDPLVLFEEKDFIRRKLDNILENFANERFIFNLGHGIMQHTKIENVEFLVDYVRNWKK